MVAKDKADDPDNLLRDEGRKAGEDHQGGREEGGMTVAHVDVVSEGRAIGVGGVKAAVVDPNVCPVSREREREREGRWSFHVTCEKQRGKWRCVCVCVCVCVVLPQIGGEELRDGDITKQHDGRRFAHVLVKAFLEPLLMDFVDVFVVVTQHELPEADEDVDGHEDDETLRHPVDAPIGHDVPVPQPPDDGRQEQAESNEHVHEEG